MTTVHALRSQLQFVCNDNLKSLTIVDLEECKWPTKMKIFTSIIEICPSLAEEYSSLLDLAEKHRLFSNEIVALVKQQPMNASIRENRKEAESTFRTDYMRIVLNCLVKLRWPPGLEAFSDPLQDLFDNTAICHEAMAYILEVGVPSFSQHLNTQMPVASREQMTDMETSVVTEMSPPRGSSSFSNAKDTSQLSNLSVRSRYKSRSMLKIDPGPNVENPNLSSFSINSPSKTETKQRKTSRETHAPSNNNVSRASPASTHMSEYPSNLSKLLIAHEVIAVSYVLDFLH
jgi:hypothetical protein